jgi:hypothetical protein
MLDIQYDPELSRDRPSAKYTELLDQYITMHSSLNLISVKAY